jgi:hypothetical protein
MPLDEPGGDFLKLQVYIRNVLSEKFLGANIPAFAPRFQRGHSVLRQPDVSTSSAHKPCLMSPIPPRTSAPGALMD